MKVGSLFSIGTHACERIDAMGFWIKRVQPDGRWAMGLGDSYVLDRILFCPYCGEDLTVSP